MNKNILLVSAVLLTSSLFAQGTVSSPATYETKEGSSYAWLFGAYPGTRSQVIDGNNKGKALTINQIDMRLDWRTHSTSITRARTWTNVTLIAAASDYDKASSTWTMNHLSTPTTLFSNQVNWADAPPRPATSPNPWGDSQANDKKLEWVFKTPYVHTGKSDTVWDWTFLGGTLDNKATWGTSNKSYYLDGLTARTSSGAGASLYFKRNAQNRPACVDSSQNAGTFSYAYQGVTSYAKNSPSRPDKMTFRSIIVGGPKSGNVIAAYSTGGNGTDATKWPALGGACEGLALNGILFLVEARKLNTSGQFFGTTNEIPYTPAFVGFRHWGQFAYNDSKSGNFGLSGAAWASPIPAQPASVSWRTKHMYRNSATTTTGFSHSQSNVPLLLYYTR